MFEKQISIDEITDTSGNTFNPDAECAIRTEYKVYGNEVSWDGTAFLELPDGKEIEVNAKNLISYEELEKDNLDQALSYADYLSDIQRGN